MKTNRLLSILLLAVSMVSCTTYYQVKTRIHPDGSAHREVYAFADSAFMAGDPMKNPFMFSLDSGWVVTRFDSVRTHNYLEKRGRLTYVPAGKSLLSACLRSRFILKIRYTVPW